MAISRIAGTPPRARARRRSRGPWRCAVSPVSIDISPKKPPGSITATSCPAVSARPGASAHHNIELPDAPWRTIDSPAAKMCSCAERERPRTASGGRVANRSMAASVRAADGRRARSGAAFRRANTASESGTEFRCCAAGTCTRCWCGPGRAPACRALVTNPNWDAVVDGRTPKSCSRMNGEGDDKVSGESAALPSAHPSYLVRWRSRSWPNLDLEAVGIVGSE